MEFRELRENEIQVRIQSIKESYIVLLLYKNARVDMDILDETVGSENWQREHYECKGNLYCRVGIKCNNEWVWKSDCGSESNTEPEKGESSDSFKRACVNWGIGRSLYTAPVIRVKASDVNIQKGPKGLVCYDKFAIEKIKIENSRILGVSIINLTTKKRVFVYAAEN